MIVGKLFEVILVESRMPMTSNVRNTVYILILNCYLNKIVFLTFLQVTHISATSISRL